MADDTPVDPVPAGDVEMEEDTEQVEGGAQGAEDTGMLEDIEPETKTRVSFLDYLKSPIVNLVVGRGEEQTSLAAHEGLLLQSPFFAEQIGAFKPKGSRKIDLQDDDLEGVGSILEYLYNDEYFPKRLNQNQKDSPLEEDPTQPTKDDEGLGLLRHARVYTLAEKFGLPALKSLAHSKIHRTNSTAKGELAYARYVYQNTSTEDTTIRKPVAAFWATRSHVLRHEAEDEFRKLCLEFPQFGFDVLSLVLDQREKSRSGGGAAVEVHGTPASSRKRRRDL
ncbi:hypothetical protein BT63DRAFT_410701 [Microthyrium microscopicum]|uniref:BTB domain-containing protein n=1 Tax=Microthyrium microscopicum TaxID=703497 RepID=A0A6A6UQR8_9PEZI|nr:hypothetical protein BT63DRAFT_410701 [Microthyrium microscopicum]